MKGFLKHRWLFLTTISGVGLALDLWTKALAVKFLVPGHPVAVMGDLLTWNLYYNKKAIFGIDPARFLPGLPVFPVFLGFSILAVVVLVVFYGQQKQSDSLLLRVGLAVVMPGALGNLYDRIFFSSRGVVDFIQMNLHVPPANPWPIYNLADAYITAGVCILLAVMSADEIKRHRNSVATPDAVDVQAGDSSSLSGASDEPRE